MSCYHPLKGFPTARDPRTGKMQYKIVGYDTLCIQRPRSDTPWLPSEWKAYHSPVMASGMVQVSERYVEIPCGKCIGCRLDYSREWANRCMMELDDHDESWFVTLTYNDYNVPITYYPDENGEAQPIMTLCKKDLQDFMKRLRYFTGGNIRFYACGEYGETTYRPHYHAIIYGLHLDDLKPYAQKDTYTIYTSDFLAKVWKKGFVTVGHVTWDSCAYTARYIMKKHKGLDANWYEQFNLVPEFVQMSRRPGIARDYYERNKEHIYEFDKINLTLPDGGKQIKPAKYFDRLYDVENPEVMETVKANRRKIGENREKAILSQTTLTKQENNAILEAQKKAKIALLKRNQI